MPDISPVILWQAHKTVIHGECNKLALSLKPTHTTKRKELEEAFNQASQAFTTDPTPANRTLLTEATRDLNLLLHAADKHIHLIGHKFYLKGNKQDALLALCLRKHDPLQKPIRLRLGKEGPISNLV